MLLSFLKISIFTICVNVVFSSDTYIEKRKEIVNELVKAIKTKRQINLFGLSGMGKTVVAKQLYDSFKAKRHRVLWINWDDNSAVEQATNLIKSLPNTKRNAAGFKKLSFVEYIASCHTSTLVIVDNYNKESLKELEEKLGNFFAHKDVFLVLTSRNSIENIYNYQIPLFSEKEAISFVRRCLPNEDKKKVVKLVNHLGLYPYYVAIAAQMANKSPVWNVTLILKTINGSEKMNNVIEKEVALEKMGSLAIKKMIEEIKVNDREAYLLLGFISMLYARHIHLDLLMLFVGSEDKTREIINKFSKIALVAKINKNEEIYYDFHEITQAIVKSTMLEVDKEEIFNKGKKAFFEFYKNYFCNVFDLNEEQQVFYNHIYSFIDEYKDRDTLDLKIIALKRDIYSKRSAQEALTTIEQYVNADTLLNDNQDILFEYLIDKAFLFCLHFAGDEEKFSEGIKCCKKALQIGRDRDDHKKIFRALTRLTWIKLYSGELTEAKQSINQAAILLRYIEDSYTKKEYFFVSSWFFIEEGDFQKSQELAKEGIELDKTSKSINIGLYIYLNYSICLFRKGNFEGCLLTVKDALEREEFIFGKEKSLVQGELLQVKAMAQKEQNKLIESEKTIRESIEIFKFLKKDSLYQPSAVSQKVLGEILVKKGNTKEAKGVLEETVRQFALMTPKEGTYEFAEALYLLASIYLFEKNVEELKKIYSDFERRFGCSHHLFLKLYEDIMKQDMLWILQ